jgi:tRNA dimethylallyltransferase
MNKLLCIVGPTATGKTTLAMSMTKIESCVLFSADSRQVYKGMDIVTGKDHGEGVEVRGIDLVLPGEEFSVGHWYDLIMPEIAAVWKRGLLPVIVGGTGLYFRAILDPIPTAHVKPDIALRNKLSRSSVSELRERLHTVAPLRLQNMNKSDRQNSRRLIRAIEVAEAGTDDLRRSDRSSMVSIDPLIIGLRYADALVYKSVVETRVKERIAAGAVDETRQLLKRYNPALPAMSAIGYRHVIQYLRHELTMAELIAHWSADEMKYAKRQMTWFQKMPGTIWHEALDPKLQEQVAAALDEWYD